MAHNNHTRNLTQLGTYDWFALRYYKRPFKALNAVSRDKVISWVTNWSPNKGSSTDRRHGRTLGRYIKGKL